MQQAATSTSRKERYFIGPVFLTLIIERKIVAFPVKQRNLGSATVKEYKNVSGYGALVHP